METLGSEPVGIDLNVDAALALKKMVGVDDYPPVLALMPNIFRPEDQQRVHDAVVEEMTVAGIVCDGAVRPEIRHWLQVLDRPDIELIARIADLGTAGRPSAMLRMSLVRSGHDHVLALRCDDRVVIQPVFHQGTQLNTVTAAVTEALGPCMALGFDSIAATFEQLNAIPAEPEERRRALLALGATAHTAVVLTRALEDVTRRAEIVVIEHHDGLTATPEFSLDVLDTRLGRIVITPHVAIDGGKWSTYTRGDSAAVGAGIAALIELLPGRSWFDTARTE